MASGERYTFNEQGEKIIPPSLRADGSVRKEIRIRGDYVPLEERAKFQSRGTEWRRMHAGRPTAPPGYRPDEEFPRGQTSSAGPPGSQPANDPKPKKGRPKRKPKKTTEAIEEVKEPQPEEAVAIDALANELSKVAIVDDDDPRREQLKKYRKILRQINDLLKKQARGDEMNEADLKRIGEKESVKETIDKLKAELEDAAQQT